VALEDGELYFRSLESARSFSNRQAAHEARRSARKLLQSEGASAYQGAQRLVLGHPGAKFYSLSA
jgi:hypothetical protein